MSQHNKITPEEMSALLPDYEVSQDSWRRVKRRLIGCLAVVTLLYLLRFFILVFFPENHAHLIDHWSDTGEDTLFGISVYRSTLSVFLLFVYLYAIYNNAYLRMVAIIVLVVTFALLWSDLESLILYPMMEFQWYLILPFVVRITAIYLLFKNYLDIRQ